MPHTKTSAATPAAGHSPACKSILSAVRFCLLFFLSGLILPGAEYLVSAVLYPTLHQWLPSVFPMYNFVLEAPLANALQQKQELAALLLLRFAAVALLLRTDNRRYEAVIAETEGFYTLGEGLRVSLGRFLLPDFAALLLSPAPAYLLRILLLRLPEDAPKILDVLAAFTGAPDLLCPLLGGAGAYLAEVLVLLLLYPLAMLHALDRYRVSWLSSFAE